MAAVIDAGPLIHLSKIGRLALLRRIPGGVYVPDAVYEEVVERGAGRAGGSETADAVVNGWLWRTRVTDCDTVALLRVTLEPGESEAIALALELAVGRILTDDSAARREATLLGLEVTGTVGILIAARRAGLVTDLERDLDTLVMSGFRISRDLYAHALRQ